MNRREKILSMLVAGLVGLLLLGFTIRGFITRPLAHLDKRIAAAREKLGKINAERRAYFDAEDRLKALALKTFAGTVDQASARSGELLTRQILQSGLPETAFTRLPIGPRRLRGAGELGWNVQGEGPLANVISLLFLLRESPHLQRIENLVVTPGDQPGNVKVRFRTLTLVLDIVPDKPRPELTPRFALDSTERVTFDSIVTRDLLRPYIKRPPPAVASSSTEPPSPAPGAAATGVGPDKLRVVSLSEWQGVPEVHVRDLVNEKTLRYRPGDTLAGGTISMVDYRALPLADKAGLQSFSRVIVQIGNDFWAVERGQTLADLRKMPSDQLPPSLVKAP